MSTLDSAMHDGAKRRPGPFGPAWALLPKGQQPLVLEGSTLAANAIERLIDNGYSQVPVTDKEGRIVGVFTWQSFGKRVADLAGTNIEPTKLTIREAMEPARFIGREHYIDTETDWGDIDYVLVGTDVELEGILSLSDCFGRLNDFAEAFVILYEIEHEIRDLIRDVVDEEGLAELMSRMQIPPNSKPPKILEEFTFNQYKSLICTKSNWPAFEPVFDTMRELVDADFGEVNDLRNAVFHFRRGITPKDTDRLRRFRDRLRYDRELYARGRDAAGALERAESKATSTDECSE